MVGPSVSKMGPYKWGVGAFTLSSEFDSPFARRVRLAAAVLQRSMIRPGHRSMIGRVEAATSAKLSSRKLSPWL